jgi:hypothetical protein
MRTPPSTPLLWLPVWVALAVGVVALVALFLFVRGTLWYPPEWRMLGIEPPSAVHVSELGCCDYPTRRLLVDRLGRVTLQGERIESEALFRRLWRFSERRRYPDDSSDWNPSGVSVRLTVDRSCPWEHAQRLIDICEHPDIRIYRLEWSVFREGETLFTEELHLRMPKGPSPSPAIRAEIGPGEDRFRLRILAADEENRLAEIRVHPDVPYGRVVEVVDRLIGDGVLTFRFVSP